MYREFKTAKEILNQVFGCTSQSTLLTVYLLDGSSIIQILRINF